MPQEAELNRDLLAALEKIAQHNFGCIENVQETIAILKGAEHTVVIVKNKYRPLLMSVDLCNKKMYLIGNLLRTGTNPISWWGQQIEIPNGIEQPLFSDPVQINMALAILVMGAGLNSLGLMLKLPLFDFEPSDHNMVYVVNQRGEIRGSFATFGSNKIVINAPIDVQVAAFDALLVSRHASSWWNLSFLSLRFSSEYAYGLPEHIAAFVPSAHCLAAKTNQRPKISFHPS